MYVVCGVMCYVIKTLGIEGLVTMNDDDLRSRSKV